MAGVFWNSMTTEEVYNKFCKQCPRLRLDEYQASWCTNVPGWDGIENDIRSIARVWLIEMDGTPNIEYSPNFTLPENCNYKLEMMVF